MKSDMHLYAGEKIVEAELCKRSERQTGDRLYVLLLHEVQYRAEEQ